MNRRETSNALMREVVGYAERTGRRPERWAITSKTWDALQEELRGANSLYTPWGVVWLVKDCECGASAHHEPTPGGCTPPARTVATLQDVADAINRGELPGVQGQAWVRDGLVIVSPVVRATYDAGTDPVPRLAPYLPAIEAAVAKAASDSTVPPDIATEQREAWTGPTTNHTERWGQGGLGTPSPTPAAMLGEAVGFVNRTADLLRAAGCPDLAEGFAALAAVVAVRAAVKRENEARAWGPDGKACATCGQTFPSTSVRDAHQATAHVKCGLCGGTIGPDITGRPMCYRCGPEEMKPYGA